MGASTDNKFCSPPSLLRCTHVIYEPKQRKCWASGKGEIEVKLFYPSALGKQKFPVQELFFFSVVQFQCYRKVIPKEQGSPHLPTTPPLKTQVAMGGYFSDWDLRKWPQVGG